MTDIKKKRTGIRLSIHILRNSIRQSWRRIIKKQGPNANHEHGTNQAMEDNNDVNDKQKSQSRKRLKATKLKKENEKKIKPFTHDTKQKPQTETKPENKKMSAKENCETQLDVEKDAETERDKEPDVERVTEEERYEEPDVKKDTEEERDEEPGVKKDTEEDRDEEPDVKRDTEEERDAEPDVEKDSEEERDEDPDDKQKAETLLKNLDVKIENVQDLIEPIQSQRPPAPKQPQFLPLELQSVQSSFRKLVQRHIDRTRIPRIDINEVSEFRVISEPVAITKDSSFKKLKRRFKKGQKISPKLRPQLQHIFVY